MDKHADGDAVATAIADAAADCGISLVASLPDGWITSLIERFETDARFRHVAVNREESAIGLCSGAYFSGISSASLHGWMWLVAAFIGSIIGTRLRPLFGLTVEKSKLTGC